MKKKIFKKIGTIILSSLFLAASITGCQEKTKNVEQDVSDSSDNKTDLVEKADTKDEKIVVRLGDQAVWGYITFAFAEETGILEKAFEGYNIEFKITDFENGPADNEAFAAGELDIASMGHLPAITGSSSGYGFKIVAATTYSEYPGAFVVPIESTAESIADLKGKRLGTVIGGGNQYTLAGYLEEAGFAIDDFEILNTGSETATSIKAGEIDGGVVSNAVAAQLVNDGEARILVDKQSKASSFQSICVSDKFLEEHSDVVVILLQALNESLIYADEHQDEYFEFFEKRTGTDSTTARETWNLSEHKAIQPAGKVRNAGADLLSWMKDNNLLSNNDVEIDDLYDTTYAQTAGLAVE